MSTSWKETNINCWLTFRSLSMYRRHTRGVVQIFSNIEDGAFFANSSRLLATYYFHKKFHQMFDTFQHIIFKRSSIRCLTHSNILFSQEVSSDVWHIPTCYFHKKFHQMFDKFQHIIFTRSSIRCLTHSNILFPQKVPSDVWHIPTYYFHKKFRQMFDTFQNAPLLCRTFLIGIPFMQQSWTIFVDFFTFWHNFSSPQVKRN